MAMKDAATGRLSPIQSEPLKFPQANGVLDGALGRFVARDVPPMGYKLFAIVESEQTTETLSPDLACGEDFIENEFYRIAIDPASGAVASVRDKRLGQELCGYGKPVSLQRSAHHRRPDGRVPAVRRGHAAGTRQKVSCLNA
jgi:hypothetical protein